MSNCIFVIGISIAQITKCNAFMRNIMCVCDTTLKEHVKMLIGNLAETIYNK